MDASTKLTNGSTVTADEAYVRESIVKPEAKIVVGFDDVMPKPELTEEETQRHRRVSRER